MNDEEHKLSELRTTFSQYCSLFEQKEMEYLARRVVTLISEISLLVSMEESVRDEDDLEHLQDNLRDLVDSLVALQELSYTIKHLTSSLYQQWMVIKALRQGQGFISTEYELKVKKIVSNLIDKTAAASLIPIPVSEIDDAEPNGESNAEGEPVGNDPSILDPDNNGNEWMRMRVGIATVPDICEKAIEILTASATRMEDEADDSSKPRELLPEADSEKLKREKQLKSVKNAALALLESDGLLPPVALRLANSSNRTPDNALPAFELNRRKKLAKCQFKVDVNVNGKKITSTPYKDLNIPSYTVLFNSIFEFRVFHMPREVSLDVYMTGTSMISPFDIFIASVNVPFPAQGGTKLLSGGDDAYDDSQATNAYSSQPKGEGRSFAHTYAPITGWYSFSSGLIGQKPRLMDWFSFSVASPSLQRRIQVTFL